MENNYKLLMQQDIKCGLKVKSYNRISFLIKKLKKKKRKDAFSLLKICFFKISILVTLIRKKKKSLLKIIPQELYENKRVKRGLRLLYKVLKKRIEKTHSIRLFNEFLNILKGKGLTLQEKRNLYVTAMENRGNIALKRRKLI